MLLRLRPYLIIAAIALLFFSPLVFHPTQVLYSSHSDLLAMHLPLKRFLVGSWQETGEIPLWCPYSFAGMPLVHDVQVAAFYPLHWPLYLLNENNVGAAMSWLVVIHMIIAGWCMAAYAERRGLGQAATLVAALGYMFAGKWLLHVLAAGHYIMIPLAWLPLVLLWLEQAIQQRSFVPATWAGTAFALIVLGTHPQITLYAGFFCAIWSLGTWWNINGRHSFSSLVVHWLLPGVWTALVAVALSAVQLLPALEAAPESSRALGMPMADILSAAGPTLLNLVGPGWTNGWEDRAGLAVLWVAAAVMAGVLCGRPARFEAGICLMILFFALGGAVLLHWLPGFRLFQLPGRMLMLLAFPVALLAARATQALIDGDSSTRSPYGKIFVRVAAICLLLGGSSALVAYVAWSRQPPSGSDTDAARVLSNWLRHLPSGTALYWGTALLTVPLGFWLLSSRCSLNGRAWQCTWVFILAADAISLVLPHVAVRSEQDLYSPSACLRYLVERKQSANDRWRVLDRGLPGEPSSSPLGSGLALLGSIRMEPVLGYNSFDVRRTKEYLQFVMDEDGPLRPREGAFGFSMIEAFPIKNKALLDLMGVRFLLQPNNRITDLDGSGEPLVHCAWEPVGLEESKPTAYSFVAGEVRRLPSYRVFENRDAFPRAFVVGQASPLQNRAHLLEQLKTTDFRQTVLLEHAVPENGEPPPSEIRPNWTSTIRNYTPNHVSVDVQTSRPGYLVLTDIWFPGWTCRVDGETAEVNRANFLFRAVAVPAGKHEVVFSFTPASYAWGKSISAGALAGILLLGIVRWARRIARPRLKSRVDFGGEITCQESAAAQTMMSPAS